MPTLLADKKDSIWKTYQETKSFSETAEIEHVDPRTVKKVVQGKKANLADIGRSDSAVAKATTPPRNQNVDSERKVQIKAYKLFEGGNTNFKVSQELKLSSNEVREFRKEYNDMKKADYDEEMEKRVQEKTRLEEIIKQEKTRLEEIIKQEKTRLEEIIHQHKHEISQYNGKISYSKGEFNRVIASLKHGQEQIWQLESQITDLSTTKEELQDGIQTLNESMEFYRKNELESKERCLFWKKEEEIRKVGVEAFVKTMDALSDKQIFETIRPFFDSNLFRKIFPEPMTNAVLDALASHPNKHMIFRALCKPAVITTEHYNDLVVEGSADLLDREDFRTLVIGVANEALSKADRFVILCKNDCYVPIKIPESDRTKILKRCQVAWPRPLIN